MPQGNKVAPDRGDIGSQVSPLDDSSSNNSFREVSGSWGKLKLRMFGIGPAILGRPASRLIHPHSPFAKGVVIVTVVFLFYTAVVVPVTVGFFWAHSSCYRMPTLEVDLCMDTFFLLQIVYTFFLGQYHQEEYTDDLMTVGERYLRGAFAFDLVTSCPVSYLDLWVLLQQCGGAAAEEDASNLSGLRIIRALKPLRLLKMVRILRIFRFLQVFDMIENLFRPPPLLFRVFRVLFMIGALGHACACTFWLIKTQYSTEEEVQYFTEYHGIGPNPGLEQQYILSAYFVNTIFTTVGFGDISATNTAEQLFCVVVMYAGTIVFGVLLSEIEMAVSSMRAFPRRKGRLVQELMGFLSDKDVPSDLSKKVLDWVEFDLGCRYEEEMREQCLQLVPPELRAQIVDQLHHDELYRVPLFASISNRFRERLLVDLWDSMLPRSYMPGAILAKGEEPADRLFVIQSGKIEARLEDGTHLLSLNPGEFFGEYTLVGDTRWGAEVGLAVTYAAAEATLTRVLTRERFEEVVRGYPPELWEEVNRRGEEYRARTARAREEASERQRSNPPAAAAAGEAAPRPVTRGASTKEVKKQEEKEAARRTQVCVARWTWVVRKATLLARVSAMDSFELMRRLIHRLQAGALPPSLSRARSAGSNSPVAPLLSPSSPHDPRSPSPGAAAPPSRLLPAPPSPVSASHHPPAAPPPFEPARPHPFSEQKVGYEERVRGQAPEPSLGLARRRTSISSLNDEFEQGPPPIDDDSDLIHAQNRRRRRSIDPDPHAPPLANGVRSHSPGRPHGGRPAPGVGELAREVERMGACMEGQRGEMAAQRQALEALQADVASVAATLASLSAALLPAPTSPSAPAPPSSAGSGARLLQPLPRNRAR